MRANQLELDAAAAPYERRADDSPDEVVDNSDRGEGIARNISFGEWDALVAQFDDALYDHTAFLGADLWGQDRITHIAVERNGSVVGAAQLFIFRPPLMRSGPGIAYAKFAPLWLRKDATRDEANLRLVLEAMMNRYAHEQGLCLTIVPQADPDTCETVCTELESLGFQISRGVTSERRYLVDCTLDEDEQRASLSQKWRYNLKKALKEDLSIEIVDGLEGVETFMRLHNAMRDRKNYADYTWVDRYPSLYEDIPTEMRPTVVIAYHDGTPTAGAVIGRLGRTATYLFGGTDERALHLRAGYALQWWVTNWLSQDGVRWYDLDSDSNNPGLQQFKGGLSGKSGQVVALPGEYDYCTNPASKVTAAAIQHLRQLRGSVMSAADRMRAVCNL